MSGPRLRADLAALPAYVPGRPVRAGTSGSGVFGSSGPGHKLSSNENPYPPLPSVLRAAARQAAELNRYPDMAAAEADHRPRLGLRHPHRPHRGRRRLG
jgi:histidinol-phosphate aminotransferase